MKGNNESIIASITERTMKVEGKRSKSFGCGHMVVGYDLREVT